MSVIDSIMPLRIFALPWTIIQTLLGLEYKASESVEKYSSHCRALTTVLQDDSSIEAGVAVISWTACFTRTKEGDHNLSLSVEEVAQLVIHPKSGRNERI